MNVPDATAVAGWNALSATIQDNNPLVAIVLAGVVLVLGGLFLARYGRRILGALIGR